MHPWLLGLLFILVTITPVFAQDEQTEESSSPAPPAVELERVFREQARANKDVREAGAALTDLSVALRRVELERTAGHLEEQEALALSQAILKMAQPYGELDEASIRGYAGNTRRSQLIGIAKFTGAALLGAAVLVLLVLTAGPQSLEGLAYVTGLALIGTASDAMPFGRVASALTGGIVLSLPLAFRLATSQQKLWAALTILWAGLAVYHDNSLMGAIAVAALMGLFGFVVIPVTGGYAMGWEREDSLKSGTMAALAVLGLGCAAALGTQTMSPELLKLAGPFEYSARMLGTTVGLLGLLILSCFYKQSEQGGFSVFFIAAVAACAGFGTGLGLSGINGPAGVLAFFWVFTKIILIDLGDWGWFWKLLGGSGIVYGIVQFLGQHPELFNL